MKPVQMDVPNGFIETQFTAFVHRQDQRLFDILSSGTSLTPRLTLSKIAALILAVLVHIIGFLLLFAAIYILQTRWAGSFSICWSILLLGIFWISRPRFGKKPEDLLLREANATLFNVVERVTDSLNAKPIDEISITRVMNAAIMRVGILQTKVLNIGYPLWAHLTPQERLAVLAHEIAHDANGDLTRNILLGSALNTLWTWHHVLAPSERPMRGDTLLSLPFKLIMSVIAQGVLLVLYAFQQLTLYESRQAEYLADTLAAKVAGTQAILSVLEKLLPYETRSLSVLKRTHPPVQFRMALVRSQPFQVPTLEASEDDMQQIDQDLTTIAKMIQRANQENK